MVICKGMLYSIIQTPKWAWPFFFFFCAHLSFALMKLSRLIPRPLETVWLLVRLVSATYEKESSIHYENSFILPWYACYGCYWLLALCHAGRVTVQCIWRGHMFLLCNRHKVHGIISVSSLHSHVSVLLFEAHIIGCFFVMTAIQVLCIKRDLHTEGKCRGGADVVFMSSCQFHEVSVQDKLYRQSGSVSNLRYTPFPTLFSFSLSLSPSSLRQQVPKGGLLHQCHRWSCQRCGGAGGCGWVSAVPWPAVPAHML